MSDYARVRLVLGGDIMTRYERPGHREVNRDGLGTVRALSLWYRLWCEAMGVECTRTDLRRVERGLKRELNRPLPWATK